MTTSAKLAAAARALHTALQSGHRGLDAAPHETVIAAHARDQVMSGLLALHRHLHPGSHASFPLSAEDMLHHPALGLAEALRRREPTGLRGPAPSEVAIKPPTNEAARAWVEAAQRIEAAVVDAHRSRPDPLPTSTRGSSAPAAGRSWGLAADLAAITGTVAALDLPLAAAVEGVARQERSAGSGADLAGLDAATTALRHRSLEDLKLTASLALRLAESGPLPAGYHLPPVAVKPMRVASVWALPQAVDRASALLSAAPALTGAQHRAVSLAIAMTAERLSRFTGEPLAAPLRSLASAQLAHGSTWSTSRLAAAGLGDWQPITQLRQIVQQLDGDCSRWARSAPDAVTVEQLRRTAARLPAVTRVAQANLTHGLAAGAYLAPQSPDVSACAWTPATKDLAGRVKLERSGHATEGAANAVSMVIGKPDEPRLAGGATDRRTAREILRIGAEVSTPRPAHPAVPPSPRPGRAVGRRR